MFKTNAFLFLILLLISCNSSTKNDDEQKDDNDKLNKQSNQVGLTCDYSANSRLDNWDRYNSLEEDPEPTFALFDSFLVATLLGTEFDAEIEYILVGRDSFNMIMYAIEDGVRVPGIPPLLGKFPCPQQCSNEIKKHNAGFLNLPAKFCREHIIEALDQENVNYLAVRHKEKYVTLGIYGVIRIDEHDVTHLKDLDFPIFESRD